MQQAVKVVAILAANPALTSILAAAVAAMPGLRVRSFDSGVALTTYMRLSPIDLLVCDFDCEVAPAASLAHALRIDDMLVRRDFRIIALAGTITENTKQASIASGVDEVILKPMSPKYLLERVLSRLSRTAVQVSAGRYQGPERRDRLPSRGPDSISHPRYRDNVVPLFKDQPLPLA